MTIYKVYKVTNRLNDKLYVGQTKQSIEKRFLQHFHANSLLGKAMRQCGIENFTIEVIEYCDSQEQLNEREIFWINVLNCKFPNGYNLSDGGNGFIRKPMIRTGMSESLKRFRGHFGYSQADIADKLNMSRQNYAQYEFSNNPVTPKVDFAIKLAEKFKVSTDYILGLTDDPRPVNQILADIGGCPVPEKVALGEYVTQAEFEELKTRIEKLESKN